MASGSVDSQGPQLKGPTEVISNINRLLFDAVEKAEKVLEDLAKVAQGRKETGKNFHGGQASATEASRRPADAALSNNQSLNGFNLIVAPSTESRNTNMPLGNVVPSDSSVIKNRREGVTFMCRDRIFENGDKILVYVKDLTELYGLNLELNVLVGSEQEIAQEMTLQIECSDLKSNTSPMRNLRTSI
ncbi:hypothetical protein Tcan_15508 [Toxocara canis]|uniref:Uncharacterized protein n=1 Tax=Toxocara canis TaxID=6265 RepID=A0A0B2UQV7_TOXCA|nr:hypothetical protein Tcan_15508 [Toxocara canis]